MARQVIEPQGGMSQGTRVANHVFLSGQVAFDEGGDLVGEGDAEAQAEQIFRNIERVLGKAGASLDDVTLLTAYPHRRRALPRLLGRQSVATFERSPAGTTVIVAGLLDARLLLEVEVHAVTAPEIG